jgi:hypothetical protein
LVWFGVFFEKKSCYVGQADLELVILLTPPLKCRDYRHAHTTSGFFFEYFYLFVYLRTFFVVLGFELGASLLAMQVLYHLSHSTSLFL